MYVIPSNFGNDSIALIQWALEAPQIKNESLHILNVKTGFESQQVHWIQHCINVKTWLNTQKTQDQQAKLTLHTLYPAQTMQEAILSRRQFPDKKATWCSTFLKGLTYLNWLENYDSNYDATILLPHRRDMSIIYRTQKKPPDSTSYFDDRHVEYPLFNFCAENIKTLLLKTNLPPFTYPRSLECHPCIHDAGILNHSEQDRLHKLEQTIHKTYDLNPNIDQKKIYQSFSNSCAWHYCCGL